MQASQFRFGVKAAAQIHNLLFWFFFSLFYLPHSRNAETEVNSENKLLCYYVSILMI